MKRQPNLKRNLKNKPSCDKPPTKHNHTKKQNKRKPNQTVPLKEEKQTFFRRNERLSSSPKQKTSLHKSAKRFRERRKNTEIPEIQDFFFF